MFENKFDINPAIKFKYDGDEYSISSYGESLALGEKVFIVEVNNKLKNHIKLSDIDRFIYDEINKTNPELLV